MPTTLSFLTFVIVVAAFVYDTTLGIRVLGAAEILGGLYLIKMGRISYGIRGRLPSGYLSGWPAIAVAIAVILLGVVFLAAPGLVKPAFCGHRGCA
jgi:hypothetical protein